MMFEDLDYDELLSSNETEEIYLEYRNEKEEEEYNSGISMYSLGLSDRDFC